MRLTGEQILLNAPEDYQFEQALVYLNRYESECLHQVEGRTVYKALQIQGQTLLLAIELGAEIEAETAQGAAKRAVVLSFLNGRPAESMVDDAVSYVRDWLDLDTDLAGFYELSSQDRLLGPVVEQYRGLRLIGVPSLLEALCWTVTGQQINLSFAHTLKRRLVETFGTRVVQGGREFMLFPEAAVLAEAQLQALQALQFSRVKAETLQRIARLIALGELSKEQLLGSGDFLEAEAHLVSIRGIGPWTANYVAMRCLRNRDAFPLSDVGLHNAIKRRLNLIDKPPLAQVEELATAWKPWRAYATFYLWSTLASS
ncbi:MAG: DNA-3-methyladenine glycosylase 2 [Paenibacillaceae bacterium]|jgi:DNA-3-methyladenine glycosylase II|nr:DNA-3-methyladenine glycosylase 2 [Paenibacillaceae bacterium]